MYSIIILYKLESVLAHDVVLVCIHASIIRQVLYLQVVVSQISVRLVLREYTYIPTRGRVSLFESTATDDHICVGSRACECECRHKHTHTHTRE